jgi:hypothetical protein
MNYMLEPDKTSTYYLSFSPPEKVYVRTGVHGDGSCFYHAYLRITKNQYKNASYDERRAYVSRLRNSLAESVTSDSLSKLNNKELRRMLFFEQLRGKLTNEFASDNQYGSLLNKFVSLEEVLDASTTFDGNFYTYFIEKISEIGRAQLGKKFERFIPFIKEWSLKTFSETNEEVIKKFKMQLLKKQVSSTEIEYIARQLECNFLFLREQKVYPFSANIDAQWPYIILLWKSDIHFEIIGELSADKSIRRKFSSDDKIVKILTENDFTAE